jgi:formyl-CoA transferase
MIEEARLGDGRAMKIPGVVPKLSDTPGGTRWLGPDLGEHTDLVLGELGYDAGQIGDLRERGVV